MAYRSTVQRSVSGPCAGDIGRSATSGPEPDGLIGVVLGGAYQLVGRIGEGGMGAVYEAHHLRLHKRVAVKLLSRHIAKHPDAVARFHREASVASRLGHPNLVDVIDFGTSDEGEPFLVMEHLEGEDLDRRLRRVGRISPRHAVRIASQVAAALAVVHAKGIVHRDLKPANVFLVQVPGEPDFVKVLDFGVSKIKAARTKLTDDSALIGTPQYMSPEQVCRSSEEVDHRADQWALACIVWEMLTGNTPFSADSTDALFYQLLNLPPPPLSTHAPDLPSAVEPVLLRALSKRASQRYPSIKEFTHALESAALGSWSEVTPVPMSTAMAAKPEGRQASPENVEAGPGQPEVWAGSRLAWSRWRGLGLRLSLAGVLAAGILAAFGLRSSGAPLSAPPTRSTHPVVDLLPTDDRAGKPVGMPVAATEAKRPEAAERPGRAPKAHARRPGPRHPTPGEVANRDGKRPIFEEL